MLVLARRPHEKVVLPDCQTTIEVVRIHGNQVRLGISAPDHVRVLRHELIECSGGSQLRSSPEVDMVRRLRHLLRNQLQTSTIGLALLRRQLEIGNWDEVEATLAKLENELGNVRQQCQSLDGPANAAKKAIRRALLVEDNHNERELLAGFLRVSGFDVATAGDGADALDYLQSHDNPDVLLLDMMMPRCDGPTTVRQIRANPRLSSLKIFAVSGASRDQLSLPCGPTGVDGWFAKPVDPNTLVAEMKRTLETADHAVLPGHG
jgi:two-component system, OmpR family, response regulator